MVDATAKSDVLRANDAFYDAVRAGDFARMDQLISRERPVTVFHPGWTGLNTREDVMASWAEIFVSGKLPDAWPVDEVIIMTPLAAMVCCSEIIGDRKLSATNVFVWEDGAWRMTQHMAFG